MNKKLLLSILPALLLAGCSPSNTDSRSVGISDGENRNEISTTYKDSATKAWEKLGYTNVTTPSSAARRNNAVNIPDVGVQVDPQSTNGKVLYANAGASVALINLVGDLYANPNFTITDNVVEFTVTANFGSGESTYIVQLLPKLDKTNNKILVEISLAGAGISNFYYHLDLDYNFGDAELNGFKFALLTGTNSYCEQRLNVSGEIYLAYDQTTGISQDFINAVDSLRTEFAAKLTTKVVLTGDFNTEFTTYNTISQGLVMAAFAS